MKNKIQEYILSVAKRAAEASTPESCKEFAEAANNLASAYWAVDNKAMGEEPACEPNTCKEEKCCGEPAICVGQALKVLCDAFAKDDDFAWTWHSNIACSCMDEGVSNHTANEAAARFMKLAFDCDVTQFEQWRDMKKVWASA